LWILWTLVHCRFAAKMSGRGKARKPAGGKKHTKSSRAGLVMPVGRVHRYLKLGRYARRTSTAASVYLSAVIEYLVAEVNELSGNAAKANKRKTITPRHIMLGVRNDAELNELLKHVHISHGGVLPCIHPSLLKRKSASGQMQNSTGVVVASSSGRQGLSGGSGAGGVSSS
uniref:Histone H2A n=2 Tax=Schistocephalus solidus TaxID=70667 RepID=A0A183TPJ6_SCHSO